MPQSTTDARAVLNENPEPDYASIRSQLLANNQGVVDAIGNQYASIISEAKAQGQVLDKRQRAVNVAGGLQGSSFASSNAQQVEDQTNKIVKNYEMERDAKVQSVLSGVAMRAQESYEKQRSEYRQNAEDIIARDAKFKEQALDDLAQFAKSGISTEDLKTKSPDTWAQLLKETGYDDNSLTALMTSSRPQATKVFEQKVGNNIVLGYRDPTTGAITTDSIEVGDGYDDLKIIDGQPYFVNIADGKLTKAAGYTKPAPKTKVFKSGALEVPEDYISRGANVLEVSRESNGGTSADPKVYTDLYTSFVKDGGLPKDFVKQYPPNFYIDPADNGKLPIGLRNLTKQPTSDKGSKAEELLKALEAQG